MLLINARFLRALLFSVIMFIVLIILLSIVDSNQRLMVIAGVAMVTGLGQATLLFGSVPLRAPLRGIQRAFIHGNYEEARDRLKKRIKKLENEEKPVDMQTLALLGNTYRQLGELEESERLLREAVQIAPGNPFPLYGLGRTLLVKGQYQAAALLIEASLEHPTFRKAIRVEYSLALYYADADPDAIKSAAKKAARVLNMEAYRVLMIHYLLYRLEVIDKNAALKVLKNTAGHLDFWKGEARRHAETPFGKRLQEDITAIEAMLKQE